MNKYKEKARYNSEVMLAFAEGHSIEYKFHGDIEWSKTDKPLWIFEQCDYRIYRIKIEPRSYWLTLRDGVLGEALPSEASAIEWIGNAKGWSIIEVQEVKS